MNDRPCDISPELDLTPMAPQPVTIETEFIRSAANDLRPILHSIRSRLIEATAAIKGGQGLSTLWRTIAHLQLFVALLTQVERCLGGNLNTTDEWLQRLSSAAQALQVALRKNFSDMDVAAIVMLRIIPVVDQFGASEAEIHNALIASRPRGVAA